MLLRQIRVVRASWPTPAYAVLVLRHQQPYTLEMAEAKLDFTQGDLLSQRGIIGGLLAGIFIVAPCITSTSPEVRAMWQAHATQLPVIAAILGIALTHISFELCMPTMQRWLEKFAAVEFQRSINVTEPIAYERIRRFREKYLQHMAPGDHHGRRLAKHDNLRRTSTYLTCAGIVGLVAEALAAVVIGDGWRLLLAPALVVLLGYTAQFRRTAALSRALAYAFHSGGGKTAADLERTPTHIFSTTSANEKCPIRALDTTQESPPTT